MVEKARNLREERDVANTIELYADTVIRVCSLYFGVRPERDDAFQDTFLKYALSETQFNGEEHRKAWLIRVATNVCKDALKKAEAKTVLLDEFDDASRPQWQPESESGEQASQLTEALRGLDERYRIPLYLKYYEGYSAAEIAKMTDVPENTVYTNLARGREKLKEVLARE